MKPVNLYLDSAKFDDLHKAADGKGVMCRVPKEDLRALLMDQSRLLKTLKELGIEVKE